MTRTAPPYEFESFQVKRYGEERPIMNVDDMPT